MNKNEIIEKLKLILNQRFNLDTSLMSAETRLGDIGIDSLLIVDIMLDVENELGFNFQDLALPPNPSLSEISDSILNNL